MNQTSKTIQFIIVAIASVAVAGLTSWATKPRPVEGYGKVGEPFFPDLTDPNTAAALQVVVFNEDTASIKPFRVEQTDGIWRIPTHFNYPADGKDRLAKTAASLIGVKRDALVSRVATDHERYGVLDPVSKETESLKGRGQRITLEKAGKEVLADLIIGKKVEGRTDSYYVRRADERETYIADLKVDISTKFRDWVEDDLLKLDRDSLVRLDSRQTNIADGKVEETSHVLTREKSTEPWKFEGLNEETEELNKTDIDSMVSVLDNLKLVGIRQRPQYEGKPLLQNDLSVRLPKGASQNRQIVQIILQQLRDSLEEKGFVVYQDDKSDQIQLYSAAGELVASTNDGVRYHMNFGNVFTATEDEIEGRTSEGADSESAEKKTESKEQKAEGPPGSEDKDAESKSEKSDEKKAEEKKSRYLFVRASFDDTLVGPKPVEPSKPEVPPGVEVDENGNVVEPKDDVKKPAAEEKKDGSAAEKSGGDQDEESDDEQDQPKQDDPKQDKDAAPSQEAKKVEPKPESKAEPKPETTKEEAQTTEAKSESAKPEPAKPDPVEQYKKALADYRTAKDKYQADLKSYEKKLGDGEKKVQELNDRFANWYYVISAEDFDKLRLTRDQLVKAKEKKPEENKADAAKDSETKDPTAPADAKPSDKPAEPKTDSKEAKDEKPASESSKSDEAKSTEPKPEEKKPNEAKPANDKPASDGKSSEDSPQKSENK